MHIGREGSHDNAVLGITEFIVKGLAHHLFAGGKAGTLGVSAVGQQSQHAAVAVFREFIKFSYLPIHRRMVDFKVAGVNNRAYRSIDSNGYRVGNTVINANKIHFESSGRNFIAGLNSVQVFRANAVFFQAALQNAQSKCGTINGNVDLLHYIRQRANVVLMSVSQKDAL